MLETTRNLLHPGKNSPNRPEFTNDLQALVNDNTCSNDDRAAAVEKYILNKAVEMGVVKEIKFTPPRNPNKWGKTLAPWFNDKCKEAKKALAAAKRNFGKGDNRII
jgi:hypothetical protein